uniref:(California timema) hypothetical protein n=1 Tax=Timema californicum TaxID=61474 RepID=A0A7R9IYZ1_TIMCA|nr:unnamed protein product [Timema californicum]
MIVSFLVLTLLVVGSVLTYQLPNGGKIWALLVAGSNDYSNYRHQDPISNSAQQLFVLPSSQSVLKSLLDVCHAYQILHSNGIPDDNIIVMMYDDIAYSKENPTPGVIVNYPNGTNIYQGVPKDYTGMAVTPEVFLNVLKGNADAVKNIGTGRVLESGPNDHLFINFVDHGAPGLLAFPDSELYADTLEETLREVAKNNRFAKLANALVMLSSTAEDGEIEVRISMVIYVEACESGSLFDDILTDTLNIFVTTAADPLESSYACYFDEYRQTYLGDLFSVSWMEDTEKANLLRESLHHQYEAVRHRVNTSHVEEYGNLDIGALHISDFLGFHMNGLPDDIPAVPKVQLRHHLESVVKNIALKVVGDDEGLVYPLVSYRQRLTRDIFQCYKSVSQHFSHSCFNLSKLANTLVVLSLTAVDGKIEVLISVG